MRTKNFFLLGLICSIGCYSCQKNMRDSGGDGSAEFLSHNGRDGFPNNHPKSLTNGSIDTIQKGFGFTEGPAVDRHGNVFFTDQPNDRIYKWNAATGKVSLFLQGTGRANGMEFDREGNLIACADMHGELWKIRPDGSHTVMVNNYNGKLLNGPNDVWINPCTGGIYITDPIFPRDYWDD
ncbi:MAG: SMP-30/gluconolactonase/LRE family protein, partial [Bacteroidota bacterium]|nr:SMP-30/gluconolactonase/LRE family protein [Bacteroidota bacterium]